MTSLEEPEKLLKRPLVFNTGSKARAQISRQAPVALPSDHFTIHLVTGERSSAERRTTLLHLGYWRNSLVLARNY
jgi:hypothetical protein